MSGEQGGGLNPGIGPARLILGFAQGMVLLALHGAWEAHQWPATEPWLMSTLICVAFFIPITVLAGMGAMRFATLALWTLVASAVVAGLAMHSVWRETVVATRDAVSVPLLAALAAGLFIAYHIVAAADADRRFIASYRSYFDIAAKNAVQLGLSLAFVGAFWLLLYLGAALFDLIKIGVVRTIIKEDWFVYPVTATVFAAAVHITDVQVGLINGARNLALMLLSWLLPVMTPLAIAFLLALPFVGLEPLWAAVSATGLLLVAAGVLAVLINAAYRDGEQEAAWVLRLAARLAGFALVPLVAIAAYSLWLRIDQHGLTPERVVGAACIAVAALYAAGYGIGALWPGRWMRPLELTNIAAAFVGLGILIALLTPIADPARVAVDDQMRRLRMGLVGPETFDFAFLRDHAAKYGREALDRLRGDKSSPRAQAIAQKAEDAYNRKVTVLPEVKVADVLVQLAVFPQGARLPDGFLQRDWTSERMFPSPGGCLGPEPQHRQCELYVIDVTGDQRPDVLVKLWSRVHVFSEGADGKWRGIGYLDGCWNFDPSQALRAGRARAIPPEINDVEIDGRRVRVTRSPCE